MTNCPRCKLPVPTERDYCESCGQRVQPIELKEATDDALTSQIVSLLREGKKIEAVKLYREQRGGQLRDALAAVQEIAAEHQIPFKVSGCGSAVLLFIAVTAAGSGLFTWWLI